MDSKATVSKIDNGYTVRANMRTTFCKDMQEVRAVLEIALEEE